MPRWNPYEREPGKFMIPITGIIRGVIKLIRRWWNV